MKASLNPCAIGDANRYLEVGGVRAMLQNDGGLFFRRGSYEVPKEFEADEIFYTGLWLGADVAGEARVAASTFFQYDYYPGPLDAAGQPLATCADFNRIWIVRVAPDGTLEGDVADWPAEAGAPFDDLDGDGRYEPEAGETPTVYGHQTAFWVMNDVGPHEWTGFEPIGVEVRVTAFGFNVADPNLGYTTFYRYEVVNRSGQPLENVRLGFGSALEPGDGVFYAGSDPGRGLAYAYNAANRSEAGTGPTPPAIGFDLLSGAAGTISYAREFDFNLMPFTEEGLWRGLNFQWLDGIPLSIGGNGYAPDDPGAELTTWMYSGEPEALAFWSEVNTDGAQSTNEACCPVLLPVALPKRLEAGESMTVDLAILYATGTTFLNSVVALRTVSDTVQRLYDDGSLFEPAGAQTGPPIYAPPTPGMLPGQADLRTPADNANFNVANAPVDTSGALLAQFSWDPVEGADYYVFERSDDPDFRVFDTETKLVVGAAETTVNVALSLATRAEYWRVQAGTPDGLTPFSEVNTFYTYNVAARGFAGGGLGIVEVDAPEFSPCLDPDLPGCQTYGGALVWHTPNSRKDYYLTGAGTPGTIVRLLDYVDAALPYDYELRFTERCESDGCFALNPFEEACGGGQCRSDDSAVATEPELGDPLIVRVPFELWQIGIGTPDDPSDDIRMIPFIDAGGAQRATWGYATLPNRWTGIGINGGGDPDVPGSDAIIGMMPDREDGYARFATVAAATGAGRICPSGFDGDEQEDRSPATGEACGNQGFYVDFCYRNDAFSTDSDTYGANFIAPVWQVQIADHRRDGTPPPSGTTIRFVTTVGDQVAEEPRPSLPSELTLSVYPNPSRGTATVAYEVAEAGWVRVSVVDVLGRERAVVVEGEQGAGAQRVGLEGLGLGSGLYVVRVEAEGRSATRKVLVVR